MNTRRNFLGNLLLAGAGFFILPPAISGKPRLWVPDKRIITETVGSIWRSYMLSWNSITENIPGFENRLGSIAIVNGGKWYRTPIGWSELKRLRRPLKWMDDPSRKVAAKEVEGIMNEIISGKRPSYTEDSPCFSVALEENMKQADAWAALPIPEI